MGIINRTLGSCGLAFLAGVLCAVAGCPLKAASAAEAGSSAAPVVQSSEPDPDLPIYRPPGRLWLRADYLMGWTSGVHLPPLVTTAAQGTPAPQAGVLPGSPILFGDQTVDNDLRSGFRTTLGLWLDAGHVWHLEGDYFSLGERADGFSQTSDGNPILARPFFNVQTAQPASLLVAYPGQFQGTIAVDAREYFQSAGALVGFNLLGTDLGAGAPLWLSGNRTDFLAGFRYYNLSDRLSVAQDSLVTAPGPTQNTALQFRDNFRANNDFYGGELGLRSCVYRGRWSLEVLTKLALGNTRQTVTIDGQTVITTPNQAVQTYNMGILAVGTNSGTFERNAFTMIPQLGLDLGFEVTSHWRAHLGYSAVYWGYVTRAADQVDLNLDPRNFAPPQANGQPSPRPTGQTASFWAQSINAGVEYRF